jgi:hypothetical protein
MDRRSLALAGEPTWVRSGLEIFSRSSTMTAHDWIQIMQSAGEYILANVVDDQRRMRALLALVDACQGVLTTISPADIDDREKISALKIQVAEALALCELVRTTYSHLLCMPTFTACMSTLLLKMSTFTTFMSTCRTSCRHKCNTVDVCMFCCQVLPKTEMAVMFHILLHVPDAMYRWNAVRNFWGFFGERYAPRPTHETYTCSRQHIYPDPRMQHTRVPVNIYVRV